MNASRTQPTLAPRSTGRAKSARVSKAFWSPGVQRAVIVLRAVRQGRDAITHRAWAGAFRALVRADQQRPLAPQDLEHLALAAYMLGRSDDHLEYLKRAHRAYQDARDLLRAARCAFWAESILRRADEASQRPAGSERAKRFADRGPRNNASRVTCCPGCWRARRSATGRRGRS